MTDEIEVEFEDSRKGIKLKLKGKSEVVDAYIEKYGYASAMKGAVNREPAPASTDEDEKPKINLAEIPEKPKVTTLTEYVKALMYTKWAVPGITSSELLEVAKIHGISITSSSLSGILYGLIKTGALRRTKEAGGQWKYYPPTSVAMKF